MLAKIKISTTVSIVTIVDYIPCDTLKKDGTLTYA